MATYISLHNSSSYADPFLVSVFLMMTQPFLLILALTGPAFADIDLVGKWNSEAKLPDGGTNEAVLSFEKSEDGIKGSSTSADGERKFRKVIVEGAKLTVEFEIDYNGTPVTVQINAEEKSPGQLSGKWFALTDDGAQHVEEEWKATKALTEAEKNWLVGEWDSVASVNDRELRSVMAIAVKDDGYTGKLTSERGEQALDRVTSEGKSAQIEFTMNRDGNEIDLRINATSETPNILKGKWVIFDNSGQEAMTGPWRAQKRVPLELAGSWNVRSVSSEGDEKAATFHFTKTDNGWSGDYTREDFPKTAFSKITIAQKTVALEFAPREGVLVVLDGAEKETDLLEGTWVAKATDGGDALPNGKWTASREKEAATAETGGLQVEALIGKWDLLATIAGNESDYTLTLTHGDDDGLKGSLTSPRSGEHALDSIAINDGGVMMKITRDYNGQSMEILYEGNLKDGILSGKLTPTGLEAYTGRWQAKRKAE